MPSGPVARYWSWTHVGHGCPATGVGFVDGDGVGEAAGVETGVVEGRGVWVAVGAGVDVELGFGVAVAVLPPLYVTINCGAFAAPPS